jgi:hypothetical protein
MEENALTNGPYKAVPFTGRERDIALLEELHRQRKHVLILGPLGVGKTALIEHVRGRLPLLICPHSVCFGEICDHLEGQLGLVADELRLLQRKKRLRQALAQSEKTVVFDGVGWTTPKLSSFLENVTDGGPVWLCTRSEHPWDIGHFWRLLVRFARVELQPFRLTETQALVTAGVRNGALPSDTLNIVAWLQHRSAGSPLILCELFEELVRGKHDLSNPHALRLLDLDRRIHELFPATKELGGQSTTLRT